MDPWVWALPGAAVGLLMAYGVIRWASGRGYRYDDEQGRREPQHTWLYLVAALLVAGLAVRWVERPATLVVLVALCLPMWALAVIDQDVHRLPDRITKPLYPALGGALALVAWVEGAWGDLGRALLGAVVGLVVFLVLALVGNGGMGLGDVKLAGILGMALGWVSWSSVLWGLLAGVFLGAVWGFGLVLARRMTRKDFIPLGPFLIVGALATLAVAP